MLNGILISISIFVFSAIAFLIETFWENSKKGKTAIKGVNLLVLVLSVVSIVAEKIDLEEQDAEKIRNENRILRIQNENLSLKERTGRLQNSLEAEKKRIKSLTGFIEAELKGSWNQDSLPYSDSLYTLTYGDLTLLNLFPFPRNDLTGFRMNTGQRYSFSPNGPNKVKFSAKLAVDPAAGVLSNAPAELEMIHSMILYVPLTLWSNNRQPVALEKISVRFVINEDHEIVIKKSFIDQVRYFGEDRYDKNPNHAWYQFRIQKDEMKLRPIKRTY